jgi:cytochrome c oxidase subunit I+III
MSSVERKREPLPNSLPRPPGELERLADVWQAPRGWRILSAVNNTYIGILYIGTALLFLVLGGVLALLMRTQLAVADNDFVDYDTYNQLFTMHGSVMMFLFAVPVIEAIGILLLPAMLGARDLPFPRLSAYAYWAYAIGGLVFFGTIFFDVSPDGGWFMYPPLTGSEHSPGLRTDFWLLGIGFIEISAIAGAIEIVVGILRTRPPGMTLGRMPVYVWAMLVVGGMIIFAFPPVIAATALLELERAFDWPFFLAARDGDPVLWQHLFWLFGHPDVYIIFLPAAGLVSMMVATLAGRELVGYRWVVASLIATGGVSFFLWAHHMFSVGMSPASTLFFSVASLVVAIPAGVQVFAWIATFASGTVRRTASTWFLLGFFGVFVLGGLTGVMVALVPFDWQAHDTYFIVAHLHYVLIGGMVFPVFAGIYYWAPMVSGRQLSERMGKWACGLMFLGVHLAFFPMHFSGMAGMPRRVWTYQESMGWETWNLVSTAGAFVIAAGVLLVLIDLVLHLRPAAKVDVNPWNAGTLEWLPLDNYAARSIPRVDGRYPLWDQPGLREQVDRGQHYLPGTVTGTRETIVTSAVTARPEFLLRLPGPSWLPMLAGVGTAIFFFALTVKFTWLALAGAALALVCIFRWLWEGDPAPTGRRHAAGGGVELPDYMSGPRSHGWWGVIVLLLVNASIFASFVYSWFYLAYMADAWPPPGVRIEGGWFDAAAAAGCLCSAGAAWLASRWLGRGRTRPFVVATLLGVASLSIALAVQCFAARGADPTAHAFAATSWTLLGWQGMNVVLTVVMVAYTLARLAAGKLDAVRRATFDSALLVWLYTCAQGLAMLGIS